MYFRETIVTQSISIFFQELKESKRKKRESPKSRDGQRSITDFYRTTKQQIDANSGEASAKDPADKQEQGSSKGKKKASSPPTLPKSVRRRLLFE